MKAVKVSFRINKQYNKDGQLTNGSIAFGPRQIGEVGLDVLAVKIALGAIMPNVQTNTTKNTNLEIENNVWFDCESETPVDQEQSSTFDKKTQIRLMEFQLKHREEILRYMLGHVHYSFPEEGQVLAEDILFESEFGRLGDATLYVLHGWRATGDIFSDVGFVFEPGVNTKEVLVPRTSNAEEIQEILEESVSTIPEPNDGSGSWSDQWDRISYVGPTRGTFKERMKNEFGYTFTGTPSWDDVKGIWDNKPQPKTPPKEEVEGNLAPRSELETKTLFRRNDNYVSSLSEAAATALEKSSDAEKETRQIISKTAEQSSLAGAFHPDPFSSSVPYVITNRMQGYFYNTTYTLKNPPPTLGQASEKSIKEITSKALKEFIDYYDLPHVWIVDQSKLLEFRRLFPDSKSKNPSHNASLTDSKNWCLVFASKSQLQNQEVLNVDSVEEYLSLEQSSETLVPMIRFVEYITPTFRPGDTYRAKFEVYMPKLEFFSTCQGYKISNSSDVPQKKNWRKHLEEGKSNSGETSVACPEAESPEEISKQIEEYKMFVSKRKKEVSRRMREYSANREYRQKRQRGATAFLGDNFDIDIDADVSLGQDRNTSSFGVDQSYHEETVYDDNGFEYGENVYPHGDDDVKLSEDGLTLTYDNKILVSTVKQAAANLKAAEKDVTGLKYPSKYSSRKLSISPKREGALLDSLLISIDKILQESMDFQIFASSQGISNPYEFGTPGLSMRTTSYGIINTPFNSDYMFTFKFEKESKSMSVKNNPNDFEGYVLKSITFDSTTITPESKTYSGKTLKKFFNASPLNRPRTVAYFAQSGKIQSGEDVSGTGIPMLQGKSCFLLGINHVKLIQKYTAPFNLRPPEGDPNTKSAATELWNEVKKSTEEWYETSINNITNPNPTYNINDLLPAFGPNCSLEELWDKFLAKFDLLSLICEWVKCIKLPQINISLDFDFRLPPIPKLPTIDFMNFLRMMLIEFLVEMLVRMLCAMATAILDLLKFPDCEDLFADNFGKYDFGTLADQFADPSRFSDNPFGGQAALGVRALSQAMTDTGVPKSKLEDMKSVIDDIFSILTPREVCQLFKGQASQRVITAVQNLLKMSPVDQDLVEHFSDEEKLLYFFESVGVFFDPQLCEKLEELDKITGEITCKERFDAIEQLREELSKNSEIDEDEIQRLLDIAKNNLKNRASKLEDILSGQPLSKVIPSLFSPGDDSAVVSSLPDSFKNSLDTVARGIFDTAKMTYTTDLGVFVPSLYNNVNQLAQPGDPEYDEVSRLFLDESVERLRIFNESVKDTDLNQRPAFIPNRPDIRTEATPRQYSVFTIRENLYKPFVKMYYNEDQRSANYKNIISEEDFYSLDDSAQQEYVAFYPKEYSVETDSNTGQMNIVTKLTPKYPLSTPELVGQSLPSAFGIGSLSMPAAGNLKKMALFGPSFQMPQINANHDGMVDVVVSKYDTIKNLMDPSKDFEKLEDNNNALNNQLKGIFMKDIQDRLLEISETVRTNTERAIKVTSRNQLLPEIRPFFDISLETMKNKWEMSSQDAAGLQDIQEIYESGTEDNSRVNAGGNVFQNFFEGVDSYLSDGRPAIALKFQPTSFINRIDSTGPKSSSIITMPIPSPPAVKLIEENSPSNNHYRYSIQVIDPYLVGKNVAAYDNPKIVKYSYCKPIPEEFKEYIPDTIQYARRDTYASLLTKNIQKDLDRYNVSYTSQDTNKILDYGKNQIYRSLLESVFEFLVTSLYESKIFDPAYVTDLEKRITGKKHFDLKTQCVSNVSGLEAGSVLSFNDLIKDFVSEVEKEFAKPENKPEFMDYSKPGPVEKAFQNVIVKAIIRIFYVEFMLRGAIMNSMFNPCFITNNKFFDDYMFDFVKSQIENKDFFAKSSSKEEFLKVLIRTAGLNTENLNLADSALKSLLVQGKNKFLKDSIKLYQTDRQDYIADFTDRIPSRDVMPYRLQWIDEEFDVVQNPPINYHPTYNFDIWTQDIPKDYRINGGFFLEYYIRMKKKGNGESLTDFSADPSEIIRRNLRNEISQAQSDPNNPLINSDNFDAEEVLDLNTQGMGPYLNEITLPTTQDAFRNKELISIEELGLLYQKHLDSYFDENFADALTTEFEEGLDYVFSSSESCAIDGSDLSRKPKVVKKLPVRLIKRDRAHFRITNTLNSEIILRDAQEVLIDSLVYDSTSEGDTRYYAIPGNYCQASTQINKSPFAAVELTNLMTTNSNVLRRSTTAINTQDYNNYATSQAILDIASDVEVGGRRSYNDHFGGYEPKYLDPGMPNMTNHIVEGLAPTPEMSNSADMLKKKYVLEDITEDDIFLSADTIITSSGAKKGLGNTTRGITKGLVAFPNTWFASNLDQTAGNFVYWHPFDPGAPWNVLDLKYDLENLYTIKLGQLTKQEFSDYVETYKDSSFSAVQRNAVGQDSTEDVMVENWVEIVVDLFDDAAVPHYSPGESFHYMEEMPVLSHEQLHRVDKLIPKKNVGLVNTPMFWTFRNFNDTLGSEDLNQDDRVNGRHSSPENPGYSLGRHFRNVYGIYGATFIFEEKERTNMPHPSSERNDEQLDFIPAGEWYNWRTNNASLANYSKPNHRETYRKPKYWSHFRMSRPLGYSPISAPGSLVRHTLGQPRYDSSQRPIGESRSIVVYDPVVPSSPAIKIYETNKYYVPIRLLITQISNGVSQTEVETYVKVIIPKVMQARKETETTVNNYRKAKLQEALNKVYNEYVGFLQACLDDLTLHMGFSVQLREGPIDASPDALTDYRSYAFIRDLPSFAKTAHRNSFVHTMGHYSYRDNSSIPGSWNQRASAFGRDEYEKRVSEHLSFCSVEKIYSIAANLEAQNGHENFGMSQEFLDKQFLENPGILTKDYNLNPYEQKENYQYKFLEDQDYLSGTTEIKRICRFIDFTTVRPADGVFDPVDGQKSFRDIILNDPRLNLSAARTTLLSIYNIAGIWYGQRRYDGFWGDTSYKPWLRGEVTTKLPIFKGRTQGQLRARKWLSQEMIDKYASNSGIYQSILEIPDGPLLGISPFVADGRWSFAEQMMMEKTFNSPGPEGPGTSLGVWVDGKYYPSSVSTFYERHGEIRSLDERLAAEKVVYLAEDRNIREGGVSYKVPDTLMPLYNYILSIKGSPPAAYDPSASEAIMVTNKNLRNSSVWYCDPEEMFWTMMAQFHLLGAGRIDLGVPVDSELRQFEKRNMDEWKEYAMGKVNIDMFTDQPLYADHNAGQANTVDHKISTLRIADGNAVGYSLGAAADYSKYLLNGGRLLRNFRNYDREKLPKEKTNNLSATLRFFVYPRTSMAQLMYLSRMKFFANYITEMFWSEANPIINEIVNSTRDSLVRDVLNEVRQAYLNTEIKFGVRLVQVLRGNLANSFVNNMNNLSGGNNTLKALAEEERSYFVINSNELQEKVPLMTPLEGAYTEDSEVDKTRVIWASEFRQTPVTDNAHTVQVSSDVANLVPPMVCLPLISHEKLIDPECISWEILEQKYRNPSLRNTLKQELLQKGEYKSLFNFVYPLNEFATMVNIFSLMILSSRTEMQEILDPTKSILMTIFETMSNRNDFGRKTSAFDHLGATDLVNSELFKQFLDNATSEGPNMKCIELPSMGNFLKALVEQIINIIKYTPSIILRGIASAIDPCYIEMKQKHFSCGEEFVKNLGWSSIAYKSEKKYKKLLDGSSGCKDGKYVPVFPAFPIDLGYGIGTLDFSSMGRSLKKFTTYIYKADLPFFKFDFQFDIPCLMDEPFKKSADGFDLASNGRYGHPISPITVLALSTPELPTEKNPSGCALSCPDNGSAESLTPPGKVIREATEGCPDENIDNSDGNNGDNNPC